MQPDNTKPGTYDIVASDADAGGNYKISYATGKLTVTKPEPAPVVTVAKMSKRTAVVNVSKFKVAVSWKAAKGAKSYQLQWRKAGASKWTTVSVMGKSKTVTSLKKGTLYEFRVRGINGKVKGKWSAASLCWLKAAAKVKAVAGKSKGSVKATWKADKAANGRYRVC